MARKTAQFLRNLANKAKATIKLQKPAWKVLDGQITTNEQSVYVPVKINKAPFKGKTIHVEIHPELMGNLIVPGNAQIRIKQPHYAPSLTELLSAKVESLLDDTHVHVYLNAMPSNWAHADTVKLLDDVHKALEGRENARIAVKALADHIRVYSR